MKRMLLILTVLAALPLQAAKPRGLSDKPQAGWAMQNILQDP